VNKIVKNVDGPTQMSRRVRTRSRPGAEGHPLRSDAFRSGHHRRHPDRPAGLEGDTAQRIDPLRVWSERGL